MATPAPRSLADALRAFDDDRLAALLRRRPDLMHPVPSDMTALAARATSGPSVARCLDGLDALALHVLRVAAEEDPISRKAAATRAAAPLGPDAVPACTRALDELVGLGLVWGTARQLHVVLPVRDQVADAPVPTWPRPELTTATTVARADQVDALAAVHAREAVGLVRDLLDDWAAHPPGVLRSGALALRDFAHARTRLHTDWPRTSLTIELARAALLVADDEDAPPHWVPTDQYDSWLAKPAGEQWLDLVDAWLALPRLASLADERTQVLSAERDRRAIPVLRRDVLELLAASPPGTACEPAAIEAVLDDREPRRSGELRALTVAATIREAEDLGVTGAGALATAVRALIGGDDPATARRAALAALAAALPDDIDHVLVQADLTIVAPGPLAPEASRRLRMVADVESRGHATVYRVTEDSIRRALDVGWDAAAIHELLERLSQTPVPQPLTYLIDDVARRHGAVRVGPALSYVRSDDPEVLSALVADRRLRNLSLRRIADTVLISQSPTSELLTALRGAGLAPAAEGPDGAVVVRRPDERRVRTPRPATVATRRADPERLAAAAVRSLRAADGAGRSASTAGPAASVELHPQSASAVVVALRRALADTRSVWLGYAGTDGAVSSQVVDPIRLHGGVLTAFDHRTDTVRDFSVSRVTAVADA